MFVLSWIMAEIYRLSCAVSTVLNCVDDDAVSILLLYY